MVCTAHGIDAKSNVLISNAIYGGTVATRGLLVRVIPTKECAVHTHVHEYCMLSRCCTVRSRRQLCTGLAVH